MKQPIRKYYYGHFWTYYYDYYSIQKLPYQNKKSCWLCNILQAFMSFIIFVTKYIPMSCTVWLLINMKYFPIHKYYYILARFLALVTMMVTKVDHSNHRNNDRSNHRGYYDGYYGRY